MNVSQNTIHMKTLLTLILFCMHFFSNAQNTELLFSKMEIGDTLQINFTSRSHSISYNTDYLIIKLVSSKYKAILELSQWYESKKTIQENNTYQLSDKTIAKTLEFEKLLLTFDKKNNTHYCSINRMYKIRLNNEIMQAAVFCCDCEIVSGFYEMLKELKTNQ